MRLSNLLRELSVSTDWDVNSGLLISKLSLLSLREYIQRVPYESAEIPLLLLISLGMQEAGVKEIVKAIPL